MAETPDPPQTKYRYTVVIDANSHEEIERELHVLANGGHIVDSHSYQRDDFHCISGRADRHLQQVDPEMTAEQYKRDLDEWWQARRANRDSDVLGSDA